MSKPFFSIVTVCYNSGITIGDTLKSVAEQSCSDFEHIVVDGGSTDATGEVVAQFPNVRFLSEPDDGIYDAMNKGIAASTGEFIALLNADDFFAHREVLTRIKEKLEQSGAHCLYADLDYVDPQNPTRVVRHWVSGKFDPGAFKRGWMPPHPTFVLRKSCYNKWGTYRTDFRISADYELMLRMLLVCRVTATYLPVVTVKMRAGGISNASFAHRLLANREDRKAWKVNGLRVPFYTPWLKPLRKVSQFFSR